MANICTLDVSVIFGGYCMNFVKLDYEEKLKDITKEEMIEIKKKETVLKRKAKEKAKGDSCLICGEKVSSLILK